MALVNVVCSLITGGAQTIPSKTYTTVRFPFTTESYDNYSMHTPLSPPNVTPVTVSMKEAGLIWPAHDAWGHIVANMQWQDLDELSSASRPTHFRHRLVRDPFGYTSDPVNTTCTTDHLPRPEGKGLTCKSKAWSLFVHPSVPLAYQVYHDAQVSMKLELSEFKLSYLLEI